MTSHMHKDIKSFCIIMGMVGASTASSSCEQKLASVACLQGVDRGKN